MTIEHKEPDFEEAMRHLRRAMEKVRDGDLASIEVNLQHVAASLGRNPALVYPDYDSGNGPDYWYECHKCGSDRVFRKSEKDWVCPFCDIND